MGKNVSIVVPFAKIFEDENGICFGGSSQGVEDVIVQHHVLEVLEAGDLFILAESIDNSLYFCQHVVQDNLFSQRIYNFIVVDGLGA